jgi:hypothetical protein
MTGDWGGTPLMAVACPPGPENGAGADAMDNEVVLQDFQRGRGFFKTLR